MINWVISGMGKSNYSEEKWYFISFPIQEYLIPMINVGKPYLDEYGDTKFDYEDCRRMVGNINYLIDCGMFKNRQKILFETFSGEKTELKTEEIKNCLEKLKKAANMAFNKRGTLLFIGD